MRTAGSTRPAPCTVPAVWLLEWFWCSDAFCSSGHSSGAFAHESWEVCPADPKAQVQGGVSLAMPLALCSSSSHCSYGVFRGLQSAFFPAYPTTFQDAALPDSPLSSLLMSKCKADRIICLLTTSCGLALPLWGRAAS